MSEESSITVEQFKRGLTWRSLLALLYVVFVFQAALAYLQLMTGSAPSISAIQWAAILLFLEMTTVFAGSRLTLQEAIIIYLACGQTIKFWWFLAPQLGNLSHPGWIYQIYLRYSPVSKALGLADKIPWFYAPSSPEVWIQRTFFNPEWAPVAIWTIAYFAAAICGDLAMSILAYHIYVVSEKLPFPLAEPVVVTAKTLVGREWRRLGVLSISTLIAMVYGFVLYSLPLISSTFWKVTVRPIPVPWIDMNALIQSILPGASFGIMTDLAIYAMGFIIPFQAALGMLIGATAIYIFGNHLLVRYGITGFAEEYSYGMSIQLAWQRSVLWIWGMVIVGFGVAIGLVPILLHPKRVSDAFKSLGRIRGAQLPIRLIIGLFLGSTIALSIVDHLLAPDLPFIYFILLNVIWPFLLIIIMVRAEGIGVTFNVPYVRELTLKAIGYPGIDAWFVPIYLPSSWVTQFKICDMTSTSHKDFIKATFIIFPIALIFGFLTTQSLWSLAPIPSSDYPGVLYSWPVQATIQALFISPEAAEFFRAERILYGFAVGAVLYALGDRLGFAQTVVGVAGGLSSAIPSAFSVFLGSIIGLVISQFIGEERWREYRGIIFAGILLGEGLVISIGTGLAIIIRSMWAAPY